LSPTDFDIGFFVGLMVGEGHFGGDGRQPHITLRMHTDHERLFDWLVRIFPGGRLYGPYHHGGRSYYQWMARGPFLRDEIVPLLDRYLVPEIDGKAFARFTEMKARYTRVLTRSPADPVTLSPESPAPEVQPPEIPPHSAPDPAEH
jgi:hypothetical protein